MMRFVTSRSGENATERLRLTLRQGYMKDPLTSAYVMDTSENQCGQAAILVFT